MRAARGVVPGRRAPCGDATWSPPAPAGRPTNCGTKPTAQSAVAATRTASRDRVSRRLGSIVVWSGLVLVGWSVGCCCGGVLAATPERGCLSPRRVLLLLPVLCHDVLEADERDFITSPHHQRSHAPIRSSPRGQRKEMTVPGLLPTIQVKRKIRGALTRARIRVFRLKDTVVRGRRRQSSVSLLRVTRRRPTLNPTLRGSQNPPPIDLTIAKKGNGLKRRRACSAPSSPIDQH